MHQLIDSYLNFLAVEKGASLHTLDAYGRDLGRYARYMAKKGIDAARIKPDGIISFLGELKNEGLSARSLNRVLAAMRGFHKFCSGKRRPGKTRRRISNLPRPGCTCRTR